MKTTFAYQLRFGFCLCKKIWMNCSKNSFKSHTSNFLIQIMKVSLVKVKFDDLARFSAQKRWSWSRSWLIKKQRANVDRKWMYALSHEPQLHSCRSKITVRPFPCKHKQLVIIEYYSRLCCIINNDIKLQLVQNFACRNILDLKKFHHFSEGLNSRKSVQKENLFC